MKKIILLLAIVSAQVSAGSFEKLSEAKAELDKRFTYKGDPRGLDLWHVPPKKGRVFGDCEDYALALKEMVGGRIWAGITKSGLGHVMLCLDGFCADTLKRDVEEFDYKRYSWLMMMNEPMIKQKLKDSKD